MAEKSGSPVDQYSVFPGTFEVGEEDLEDYVNAAIGADNKTGYLSNVYSLRSANKGAETARQYQEHVHDLQDKFGSSVALGNGGVVELTTEFQIVCRTDSESSKLLKEQSKRAVLVIEWCDRIAALKEQNRKDDTTLQLANVVGMLQQDDIANMDHRTIGLMGMRFQHCPENRVHATAKKTRLYLPIHFSNTKSNLHSFLDAKEAQHNVVNARYSKNPADSKVPSTLFNVRYYNVYIPNADVKQYKKLHKAAAKWHVRQWLFEGYFDNSAELAKDLASLMLEATYTLVAEKTDEDFYGERNSTDMRYNMMQSFLLGMTMHEHNKLSGAFAAARAQNPTDKTWQQDTIIDAGLTNMVDRYNAKCTNQATAQADELRRRNKRTDADHAFKKARK